jgi:hypothetical protein
MGRLLPLLLLGPALAAAEGYAFAGPPRTYLYHLDQQVAWTSAGDQLVYRTEVDWRVLMAGRGQHDGRSEVSVTVLRVVASHRGPGSDRRFDSASGGDDTLLGHLKAVEGAVLTLVVDARSGLVSEVRGADAIAEGIARRSPDLADPGAPSPLAEAARQAYAPARLARLWSQVLARPVAGPERLPLGEPLSGEAVRSWSGDTWTLVPAAGAIPVTFLGDPTPVAGRVVELTGSGGNQQRDGWPAEAKGALTFTLELDALTQPVRQSHRIAWTLTDVTVRR